MEDLFDLMVKEIKKYNNTQINTATKFYNWDWNNIKNSTDKYEETLMKIKKFKYIIEEIKPFIKPKKWKQYSTNGKWVDSKSLPRGDEPDDRK